MDFFSPTSDVSSQREIYKHGNMCLLGLSLERALVINSTSFIFFNNFACVNFYLYHLTNLVSMVGTTISPWIVTLDALEPFACNAPIQVLWTLLHTSDFKNAHIYPSF